MSCRNLAKSPLLSGQIPADFGTVALDLVLI